MNKYAQYGEEDFLESFFKDRIGYLCDIGASEGIRFSNSRLLIEKGWSGLLIEPNPLNFSKLYYLYRNNNKIKLAQNCCYYEDKGIIDFYCDTYDGWGQISTMSNDFRDICENMYQPKYVTEKIECLKTSNVFDNFLIPNVIDFVSIDCEGVDFEVLSGIDFNKYSIELLCIENRDKNLPSYMSNLGYKMIHKTEGNEFYSK